MAARRRPAASAAGLLPPERLGRAERRRLALAFRALADPSRLELLRLLARQREPACVRDLVRRAGRSQPTVSHHLRVLREAGLVRGTRQGIWVFYEARPAAAVLLAAARGVTTAGERPARRRPRAR